MEETRRNNKREVKLKHLQYFNKISAPRDFRFTFTHNLTREFRIGSREGEARASSDNLHTFLSSYGEAAF